MKEASSVTIAAQIDITETRVVTTLQAPRESYLQAYLSLGKCVRELLSSPSAALPHFEFEVGTPELK